MDARLDGSHGLFLSYHPGADAGVLRGHHDDQIAQRGEDENGQNGDHQGKPLPGGHMKPPELLDSFKG